MYPKICSLGPITVYSYGAALAIAFIVAVALASSEAKRRGIDSDFIFNLSFAVLVFGIIGARLFYVFSNLGYYLKNPLEIIMLPHGGMSWFGGFFLGLASGVVLLKKRREGVYRILDLIAPFLALAQSLDRIGCFLNGCCFGRDSSYGIYFPLDEKILIPTQLYSSLLLLIIFIILRFIQDRSQRLGVVFYSYIFLYSIKRFFIEFFRADNSKIIFNLTLFQLICIPLFFFALFKLIALLKPQKKQNEGI